MKRVFVSVLGCFFLSSCVTVRNAVDVADSSPMDKVFDVESSLSIQTGKKNKSQDAEN